MAKGYEETAFNIQSAFMELFEKYEIHEMTIKMICEKVGIARTTFYNYFSDIYNILETIEEMLINELMRLNGAFYKQDFSKMKKLNFDYFNATLIYIQKHSAWFQILLKEGKDGQFIYKWKRIIQIDFARKYHHENIPLQNEQLVLETISGGVISAYRYWVNNLNSIDRKVISEEILYRVCSDFI